MSATVPEPRRLALVIATLGLGGAERVLSALAGVLAEREHFVTVITLGSQASDHYPLAPGVGRIALDLLGRQVPGPLGKIAAVGRRIRALGRALNRLRPALTVSFGTSENVVTLLAARRGSPVIVSERTDPRRVRLGRGVTWMRRRTYRRAGAIVVQTRAVADWAARHFPGLRVRVIPNPVAIAGKTPPETAPRGNTPAEAAAIAGTAPASAPVSPPASRPRLIAVGRLSLEKGLDLALRAFARLAPRFPEWSFAVFGDGPARPALLAQTQALGLGDRVQFLGVTQEVQREFAASDVFVLPSRFEGFPNALLEAMAIGLPAVAADCDSGPREIVTHDIDGLLVPPEDVDALSAALARLFGDSGLRQRLGARARAVRERFALERIVARWEQLFAELLPRPGTPPPPP